MNELWDTSIYINRVRTGLGWHSENLDCFYLSSVVIAELATGYIIRGKEELKYFERHISYFESRKRIVTPTAYDWYLTGLIIGEIISSRPDLKSKKSLLFNDCLIATSSRIVSAKVVTANKSDFQLIKKWLNFEVEYIS
jgi:predicted nucleic acid-binding protein